MIFVIVYWYHNNAGPIERIENLLGDLGNGYAKPKVDVRGAVVHNNKTLLVKKKLMFYGRSQAAMLAAGFLHHKTLRKKSAKKRKLMSPLEAYMP